MKERQTAYCMTKVEDECYLKSQLEILKQGVALFAAKYRTEHF